MLRPGGLAILTMGASDNPDGIEDDWLGAPMFFSHFDGETNTEVRRASAFSLDRGDAIHVARPQLTRRSPFQ